MASELSLAEVNDLLPSDQTEWDDTNISAYLDGGKSVAGTLRVFWQKRASEYSTQIDVSESGSSRSLSRLYDNAIRQVEYWDGVVKAEEEKADEEAKANDDRIRFNQITRI